MKHQKLFGSALALAVVAAGGAAVAYVASADESEKPAPLEGCEQTELALPDGAEHARSISAVSASGEYLAGMVDGVATLWRDGEPEAMSDEIPSHHDILGINSSATAVTNKGLLYEDGAVSQLDIPESVELETINEAGDVIGNITRSEGEGPDEYTLPVTPLLWQDGEMRELELESGNRGGVWAITDDGTAVGFQTDEDETQDETGVPWMWTADGENQPLPESDEDEHPLPLDAAGDWVLAERGHQDTWRFPLSNPEESEQLNEEMDPDFIDESGRVWGNVDNEPAYQDDDETVTLPNELGEEDDTPKVRAVSADGTVAVGEVGNGAADIPAVWNCAH